MRVLPPLLLIVGMLGCASEEQPAADSKPTRSETPVANADTKPDPALDQPTDTPDTNPNTNPNTNTNDGGLRLNELLASNRSNVLDDQGQSSDWIEIHNSGTRTLRLGGYHLTNDPRVLDKWTFPNNQVPAGGYHLVWMSGLDRTSLAPDALRTSAATIPFETTLIPADSNWKYLVSAAGEQAADANNTPSGWTAVDFDDSAFAVGPAGFGYGDEDDATKFPIGTTAVLLRHEFTLDAPFPSESLVLQVDYDDGFAAYLNGTRIAARNAPEGELGLGSRATGSHEAGFPERFDISDHAGLLQPGKNVLAIAGLNSHQGSSDMSLKSALGTLPPVCHANFRLKKDGGALYLVAPDGSIADEITYPKQKTDQTLGRSLTAESNWGYFLTPSPGSANSGPQQPQPVKSRVAFIPQPGAFEPGNEIRIQHNSSVAVDIRFTNDGSVPDGSSPLYDAPVALDDTSTFRAAAFVGDERASPVVSATYLVGRRPVLPVLSISMDPVDFVDVHLQKAGNGRVGERPAFLELFDREGNRAVATGFGIRLHGGAGRRGGIEIKKSYRTYFRRTYGDGRVKYDIIPEAGVKNFDKLVLRANFGDGRSHGSYIRDQMIRDLHADMGSLSSHGAWYVLLINSVNHGVYNVVERMDEEFFAAQLGPGQYDVIKTGNTVLSGNRAAWDDLMNFLRSTDFSNQANFEELSRRVDIENFTAYVIVNLWVLNLDWPHNNWYAARRVPDGKWSFLCWDAEWGLAGGPYGPDVDPYAFIDSGGAYGHGLTRKLFFSLISNPSYCEYYQKQVRRHLQGALGTDNAMRQLHRHRNAIAADIEHEFETRGYGKERWQSQIAEIEDFVGNAGDYFQKYTDAYFSYKATPEAEERVALIESADGQRYVVYRTADGQIHELAISRDGSSVQDTSISALAKSPPAAGQPSLYSLEPDSRRILYRGMSGHLHELSRVTAGAEPSSWRHTDLTAQLNIPVAACDPSLVVFEGVPHIAYVDTAARIREVWHDGQWRQQPLPAAPRPAGEVIISRSASQLHVTYRTVFGAACEQTCAPDPAQPARRTWTPRNIHRLPAAGKPIGFSRDGKRHIVFRAAEKWPSKEPFIFDGIERRQPGYRRYQGPRKTLVHASDTGRRFRQLDPIGEPGGNVAGNPCLVHDSTNDNDYVAFRDTAGHVQEATLNEAGWQLIDLTALAAAPPAAGEPAGLVSAVNGARYYVYRGREGHLHELQFDGAWSHRDLGTTATPAGPDK